MTSRTINALISEESLKKLTPQNKIDIFFELFRPEIIHQEIFARFIDCFIAKKTVMKSFNSIYDVFLSFLSKFAIGCLKCGEKESLVLVFQPKSADEILKYVHDDYETFVAADGEICYTTLPLFFEEMDGDPMEVYGSLTEEQFQSHVADGTIIDILGDMKDLRAKQIQKLVDEGVEEFPKDNTNLLDWIGYEKWDPVCIRTHHFPSFEARQVIVHLLCGRNYYFVSKKRGQGRYDYNDNGEDSDSSNSLVTSRVKTFVQDLENDTDKESFLRLVKKFEQYFFSE